jgi:hypothetical protein
VYKDEPARREAGLRLVSGLPSEDTQVRVVGVTVTPEEALFAEAPDPAFLRWVRPAGTDGALALLDSFPGMELEVTVQRAKETETRLSVFTRLVKGRTDDPVARLVQELSLDLAKLRYQEAVLRLTAGQAAPASAILDGDPLRRAKLPGTLEVGRQVASAVARFLLGDAARALDLLDQVGRRKDLAATARYVEFDRGEILRLVRRTDEARAAYRRAVELGTGFTLARRRLESAR